MRSEFRRLPAVHTICSIEPGIKRGRTYYPYVRSDDRSAAAYAGSYGKPIQRLHIRAYKNDGTKLTSGIVVMYRARAASGWLKWISNAGEASMRSVYNKYGLTGGYDAVADFAGIANTNLAGFEIRVYEEGDISGSFVPFDGSEISLSHSSYLKNGAWTSFPKSVENTTMDGIKLRTSPAKSYYLSYRTWNQGQGDYYPFVSSIGDDYAGSSGKPIQRLGIRVYDTSGNKLVSGIVVMYRAMVNGDWLPWVSNADPEYMDSVHAQYQLGGTLDYDDGYAGIGGQNITGVQIRIFEGEIPTPNLGTLANAEVAPSLSYMRYSESNWTSVPSGKVETSPIDGIRIQTSGSKSYYLQYKTSPSGSGNFYSTVRSNASADYAGLPNRPICLLNIQVYSTNGVQVKTGVVVMYRVKTSSRWLSWVSSANRDWMQSVFTKYSLDGALDTSGDGYAGLSGVTIEGVEVRIFEENSIATAPPEPVGNYKIIDVPHICQYPEFPTGCESVATVMALRNKGIGTTVTSFVNNYLDKAPSNSFDPYESFGGDPTKSSGSYGCYAPVIKKALNRILTNTQYYAEVLSGASLTSLCSRYIDKNIPVILWATLEMASWSYGATWTATTGRTVTWIKPQHCLLLVGYDDRYYYFNDPQKTSAKTAFTKASVEAAYAGLLKQAVVILQGVTIPSDEEIRAAKERKFREILLANGITQDWIDLSGFGMFVTNAPVSVTVPIGMIYVTYSCGNESSFGAVDRKIGFNVSNGELTAIDDGPLSWSASIPDEIGFDSNQFWLDLEATARTIGDGTISVGIKTEIGKGTPFITLTLYVSIGVDVDITPYHSEKMFVKLEYQYNGFLPEEYNYTNWSLVFAYTGVGALIIFALFKLLSTGDFSGFQTAKDFLNSPVFQTVQARGVWAIKDNETYYVVDNINQTGPSIIEDNAYYLAESDGAMQTGMQKIGLGDYYFAESDGAMQTGLQTIEGNTYYFAEPEGYMLTGLRTVNGSSYYFGADGVMVKDAEVEIDGNTYYFGPSGVMTTGLLIVDGKSYYYGTDGVKTINAPAEIDGGWYHFGSDGAMITGWASYEGLIYYYQADGKRLCGSELIESPERRYYFSSPYGSMVTGFESRSGNTYYYDSDTGLMLFGHQTIEGLDYYFDPETGVMQTGWLTLDGDTYYYEAGEKVYRVEMEIDGYWYCFGSDGIMITGFVEHDDKTCYYALSTGRRVYGMQVINGNIYYFMEDGTMTTGFQTIEGNDYFFDPATGISVFDMLYPVGSIYMSTANAAPNFGTWVAWGSGCVPVGVNASDTNFSTVEKTGGASTHALTTAEMPSHAHTEHCTANVNTGGPGTRLTYSGEGPGSSRYTTGSWTGSTGGGGAHNNLQPYITCYMWKRTA